MSDDVKTTPAPGRGWPRAAALFGIMLATSVVQPSVLLGVPFLALVLTMGARKASLLAASFLAVLVVTTGGPRDGVWYVERGWALLAGGCFAALTLRRPGTSFSGRALTAVGGATAGVAIFCLVRAGTWAPIRWAIQARLSSAADTALQAWRTMSGGDALPPSLVSAIYQTVEAQSAVFPALLGIASMAGLGVAWWLYVRLSSGDDQGLRPLREFRFNDHLVWLFIGGLVLLLLRWGGALAGVGVNTVVFMGALYALRGAAVIMFLSGGLSVFGYVLVALGLVFVPPLVLTGAMVVGIGDTWLDVRSRAGTLTA